jgi:ATP-dependent DNA ligase
MRTFMFMTSLLFSSSAGGFGSFLLAIYDADTEQYQAISKIGTGFSEELLKEVSAALQEHIIARPPRYYRCACMSLATRIYRTRISVANPALCIAQFDHKI